MKYTKAIVALTIVITLMTACTKDTPATADTGDKKTYLTKGPWKFISAQAKATGTTVWVDITSQNPPCQKDNIVVFKTDNTYSEDEGATKCAATDPQTEASGTWAFLTNETKLNLIFTANSVPGNQTYTITTLNDITLVLDYADANNGLIRITSGH